MKASVNFNIVDEPISVSLDQDGGFLYGLGAFETVLIYKKKSVFLSDHLERLERSAKLFRISMPAKAKIEREIERLVSVNNLEVGMLSIYLTIGDRVSVTPLKFKQPKLLMKVRAMAALPLEPIRVDIGTQKIKRTQLNKAKSLNYASNMLERLDMDDVDERILVDEEGWILEGTISNVFLELGGQWVTPDSDEILPGTMRQWVLTNFDVITRPVRKREIENASDIFLTNASGILLLASVKDIEELKSGKNARKIADQFRRFLEV